MEQRQYILRRLWQQQRPTASPPLPSSWPFCLGMYCVQLFMIEVKFLSKGEDQTEVHGTKVSRSIQFQIQADASAPKYCFLGANELLQHVYSCEKVNFMELTNLNTNKPFIVSWLVSLFIFLYIHIHIYIYTNALSFFQPME